MSRYMQWVTQVLAGVLVGVIGAGVGLVVAGKLVPEIETWEFQLLVSSIYGIAVGYTVGAPLGILLAANIQHRRGNMWLSFILCTIVLGAAYALQNTVLSVLLAGQPVFAALGYNLGPTRKISTIDST